MAEEKTEWTQEEFAREIQPVEQHFRVFHSEGRGPTGHAIVIASAVDAEGCAYYLGEPTWHSSSGLSAAPELATIPIEHAQKLLDSLWSMGLRPTRDPVMQHLDRLEKSIVFLAAEMDDNSPIGNLDGVRERLKDG